MSTNHEVEPDENLIRPHSYDGIQEYDKRLPNWWLFTLHGAIIFAVAYWGYYEWTGHQVPPEERVAAEMAVIAKRAMSSGITPTDTMLWKMSRDDVVVARGKEIFVSNCVACHGKDLTGGIGMNLADTEWVHGGTPTLVFKTITDGVTDKGMPVWGPVLGTERIAEVVAYIMTYHQAEEKAEASAP